MVILCLIQWTPINWTTCCGLQNLQIHPGQFNRQFVPQILNLFSEKLSGSSVCPGTEPDPILWSVNKIVHQDNAVQGKTKTSHPSVQPAEYVNHKLENSCKTVVRPVIRSDRGCVMMAGQHYVSGLIV